MSVIAIFRQLLSTERIVYGGPYGVISNTEPNVLSPSPLVVP
jgi:hypothetical protein